MAKAARVLLLLVHPVQLTGVRPAHGCTYQHACCFNVLRIAATYNLLLLLLLLRVHVPLTRRCTCCSCNLLLLLAPGLARLLQHLLLLPLEVSTLLLLPILTLLLPHTLLVSALPAAFPAKVQLRLLRRRLLLLLLSCRRCCWVWLQLWQLMQHRILQHIRCIAVAAAETV
jgi:hypothetical protein